ncbi:MAG: hydrogenase expression/formation protein [Sphingobacteriia bacterium]|nr:hydrogenase expression/formation protein [Sphingobacteriia bacterium]NCC41153.1 hydrogenase expression/formation protein [Gammaproteobacteria bacterium]
MPSLNHIPVTLDTRPLGDRTAAGCLARRHGNATPILYELRHALDRLITTGETTKIDLAAMPFGPGDLDHLLSVLGTGEVQASVDALGPTRIQETGIAGVWLVDYLSSEAQRLALHLEIATVPEILRPQPHDLDDAIATLDARLSAEASASSLTS